MNLFEHYIVEVHSVTPYEAEWTKKNPEHNYVRVVLTYDCYVRKSHTAMILKTEIFRTDEWEQIQKQGYYMA